MRTSLPVAVLMVLAMAFIPTGVSLAQDAPATFTVTGQGVFGQAPSSADLEFVISNVPDYSGMAAPPEVEATPGAKAQGEVAPIVDAIASFPGISGVTVSVPVISSPYSGPAALARINLTFDQPTEENLLALAQQATQAAAGEELLVTGMGARFIVSPEECESISGRAREAAIQDAQAQAGWQEQQGSLTLGEIVSIVDSPYGGGYDYGQSSCSVMPSRQYSGDPMDFSTLSPFRPGIDAVQVWIFRSVDVTWSLETAPAEATPAA